MGFFGFFTMSTNSRVDLGPGSRTLGDTLRMCPSSDFCSDAPLWSTSHCRIGYPSGAVLNFELMVLYEFLELDFEILVHDRSVNPLSMSLLSSWKYHC